MRNYVCSCLRLYFKATDNIVELCCHSLKTIGTEFDLIAVAGNFTGTLVDHGNVAGDFSGHRGTLVDVFVDFLNSLGCLCDVIGDLPGSSRLLLYGRGDGAHNFMDAGYYLGNLVDALDCSIGAALNVLDFLLDFKGCQ